MPSELNDVTTLLAQLRSGDDSVSPRLIALIYEELRGVASHMFRGQPRDHTLQPTALVNEACIRLLRNAESGWNDRKHLMRAAAQAMRQLLTDHARAKRAECRGGKSPHITVDTRIQAAEGAPAVELVALDDALAKLSATDRRLSQVFELRFLLGLSVEHTAEVLEVSARTVDFDTRLVRAWLKRELAE